MRKSQQPPSLERQLDYATPMGCSVNRPSIGFESQVAGSGQPGGPSARGTEEGMEADDLLRSRNARIPKAFENIRHIVGEKLGCTSPRVSVQSRRAGTSARAHDSRPISSHVARGRRTRCRRDYDRI